MTYVFVKLTFTVTVTTFIQYRRQSKHNTVSFDLDL